MTVLHLTIAIIYITLTMYYINKATKYPQQVFGAQHHFNLNPWLIFIWYIATGILLIGVLSYIIHVTPWNMKVI